MLPTGPFWQIGGFCKGVELAGGGSAIIGATLSSLTIYQIRNDFPPVYLKLSHT